MSWASKALKKATPVYQAINPIWGAGSTAIDKLTGISPDKQLALGAGVGAGLGAPGS